MNMQTYKLIPIIIGILLASTLSLVLADSPVILTTSATLEVNNKVLNYDFDQGSTSITLYKNNNIFGNVYIEDKERGWKYGAIDNLREEKAEYKYVLTSTDNLVLLNKQGFDEKGNFTYNYPIVYNYYPNPKDEWNEYRHIYSFEDICSKDHSDCEWEFDEKSIEITFMSDGDIDPSIENVSSCRTLSTANQYYQLNKSIVQTANADCIK